MLLSGSRVPSWNITPSISILHNDLKIFHLQLPRGGQGRAPEPLAEQVEALNNRKLSLVHPHWLGKLRSAMWQCRTTPLSNGTRPSRQQVQFHIHEQCQTLSINYAVLPDIVIAVALQKCSRSICWCMFYILSPYTLSPLLHCLVSSWI